MSRVSSIHHVNYLVRDLGAAVARFASELGLEFGPEQALRERGVVTRRARVGATWLVLVQPLDLANPIGQRLTRHGEGVFLLSFAVDDLDAALASGLALGPERLGLDGWRVADLAGLSGETTVLQLCQDRNHDR
jgi:methylmalonyl-CoA/ethylmalonyl-CoA epimerase